MVYGEGNKHIFVAISMLVIEWLVFFIYILHSIFLHYCVCPFKHAIRFFCNDPTQIIWTWFAPERKFVHCYELELAVKFDLFDSVMWRCSSIWHLVITNDLKKNESSSFKITKDCVEKYYNRSTSSEFVTWKDVSKKAFKIERY